VVGEWKGRPGLGFGAGAEMVWMKNGDGDDDSLRFLCGHLITIDTLV